MVTYTITIEEKEGQLLIDCRRNMPAEPTRQEKAFGGAVQIAVETVIATMKTMQAEGARLMKREQLEAAIAKALLDRMAEARREDQAGEDPPSPERFGAAGWKGPQR